VTGTDAVDLGFARVDVGREARQGVPEVIYGTGKTAAQITSIVRTLLRHNDGPVLATRVAADTAAVVLSAVPDGTYDSGARLLSWRPAPPVGFTVVVAAAGTADGPVAREAAAIATALGLDVTTVTDVGVAGLHRLLSEQDRLRAADTVIVVAGMEGALASAVGGLVACPVVAVPTSTGYGAGLEGITALLAMHASCAAGITVVNIDSGFGAAMAAFRLSRVVRRSAS
jgi:NCAIR mutase (PurE)-related protein